MSFKTYYRLIQSLDSSELVVNLNKELNYPEPVNWKIFVICLSLINKTPIFHKYVLTKEDKSDIAISLFIYVKSKKEVELNSLFRIIKKEAEQLVRYYSIYKVHSVDTDTGEIVVDYFLEKLFKTSERYYEGKSLNNRIANYYYYYTPDRLKPILYYYVDTGVLLTNFLSDSDKCILYLIIQQMGSSLVDEDEFNKVMPSTMKGKAILLANLATRSPMLLSLFLLFGDINKLAIFTEIFGDKNIKVPNTDYMITTFMETCKASNSVEKNKVSDIKNSAFLANLAGNFTINETNISNTFLEFFTKALMSENDTYSKGLEKLLKDYENGNISPSVFFRQVSQEMTNSVNLLSSIKKATE